MASRKLFSLLPANWFTTRTCCSLQIFSYWCFTPAHWFFRPD